MRVLFDNVNFGSSSGPNSFASKLAVQLSNMGHTVVNADESPDVQLAFILATHRVAPIVQRLDGIWFNSKQQWQKQNEPIKATYDVAAACIVQSEFDRRLIENYFGRRDNVHVVHNGTNIDFIQSVMPMNVPTLQGVDKVWSCASSWRPHKRLKENIRYFREHSSANDCLVIAGANPDVLEADPRIFYAGDLDYATLISLYRATDYFLHLAWLDHCPNVVVDAVAAGCHVFCTSSGGTSEIVGENATILIEDEWDFQPCDLYNPPNIDFTRKKQSNAESKINIIDTAERYASIMMSAL